MSISIQTNVNSLVAQQNLNVTQMFQSKTIQQLTSGYRINQSGDDAAGLAVANKFRSNIAELTQGVANANDGVAQLQIVDGGMNNIAQMLDRLKTLATQSASGTFTGNRDTLNSEFRSVVGEIDRQSQAIGLNQNGSLAKQVSIFIGGGNSTTTAGIVQNGQTTVDLTASTVDSRSLGLTGVQVLGGVAGTTDIGANSVHTSVQSIIGNANNSADESLPGFSTFKFRGPGFGDSNQVSVSVNMNNVADTSTLVANINASIQSAAGNGTAQAAAFKAAGITAAISTDSATGKQTLAFSSSTSAFQVEAGDKTANALLGNFLSPSTSAEGAALTTSVTATGTINATGTTAFGAAAAPITVRFTGTGLSAPEDLVLNAGSSTSYTVNNAISDLTTALGNDANLQGAKITVSNSTLGTSLSFQSLRGEKFNVQVTGDTQNLLGLGSFKAGASGAFDYNTIQAVNYDTATAAGTDATLEFSLNGGASNVTGGAATKVVVDLTAGDAGIASVASTDTTAGIVNVTENSKHLNLVVNGTAVAVTLTDGASTKNSIAAQIDTAITAAGGKASVVGNAITIESTTHGKGGSIQVLSGDSNTLLGFSASSTPTYGTARSGNDVRDALNTAFAASSVLSAAGLQASFSAGKITVASGNGTEFRVDAYSATSTKATVLGTVADGAAATAGFGTVANAGPYTIVNNTSDQVKVNTGTGAVNIFLTAGVALTAAQVAADLNNGKLTSAILGGTGATASVNGAGKLVITADDATKTALITAGAANSALGVLGAVTQTALAAATTNQLTITAAGNNNKLLIAVDGGTAVDVTLGDNTGVDATTVAADAQTTINAALLSAGQTTTVAVTSVSGRLQIQSNSTGANSKIALQATANSAYASLGLASGVTTQGREANVGFGTVGATFAGNTASALPTTSPYSFSGGATTSGDLAFNPIKYGGDSQTVTVSANDSANVQHTNTVTLANNGTARSGRSIDEAIDAINTSLQQSNDSTLQRVVAVKDVTGGAEAIRFLSTLSSFNVSVGANVHTGSGITQPTGGTATSTVSTGGANFDISTANGATQAVQAITTAVGILGQAQAAVGKGENQLNFAISLAQSQITNFSSAEAQIRDANVAQEAANLTKAQVLQQASIAAMAQANSAPQAILALLRG